MNVSLKRIGSVLFSGLLLFGALTTMAANDSGKSTTRPAKPTPAYHLELPGGKLDVVLPFPDLSVASDELKPDGKHRKIDAFDGETGILVTIFLEPAEKPGDAKVVRDFYWAKMKKSPLVMKDVKQGTAGPFATVEYMVTEAEGQPINQKNYNLYGVNDGIWIDIHLSKTEFEALDTKHFEALLAGAKIEPAAPKSKKTK